MSHLRFAKTWSGGIGLALTISVLFIAIFGPFLAPHPPAALLGVPFQPPDAAFPLGTDVLGRDVLSRGSLRWADREVGYATIATAIAYLIGGSLGLIAGYSPGSLVEPVVMRIMDVMLAFPAFLFLLVLTTGLGTGPYVLIIGVAAIHLPGIVRIVRAATLEVKGRGFVEAAVARGERRSAVLWREIVPNITGTLVADAAPRLTISILLVASLNYLGPGLHPLGGGLGTNAVRESSRAHNPALERRGSRGLLIVALTIGTNLLADAVAREQGHEHRPRADSPMMARPVLDVSGLCVQLANGTPIVEGVSLSLEAGCILALVGESGSGKTTVALALLGYAKPGVRIAAGTVRVGDEQLVGRPERELRRLRGALVSYVPQDPGSALNPSARIGEQLADVLRVHSRPAGQDEIKEALGRVQLPATKEFLRRYPHQLSGGQQQRVAIATALGVRTGARCDGRADNRSRRRYPGRCLERGATAPARPWASRSSTSHTTSL